MRRDSREIAALLERALARPPEQRDAFLDEACGGDAGLRTQVESLLEDPSAGPTLLQDPDGDSSTRPGSGLRADPYKLEGTTVLHYEIQERLGRGGMGVVYRAFDTRLERPVALKFILLSMSAEPQARKRFVAEARAASALDHVNICTIYEIGETESGQVYIGMAYYQGETLAEKLRRGRPSLEEALDYGAQIASGLASAHAKEILHRDVKPANVMVTEPAPAAEGGIVKILDFGLAKVEDVQLTRTGTTMGTVAYSSPEQARGEKVDQRTDVWALGVILYEMLAGERPFKGQTVLAVLQALTNDEPTPLRQLNPEVPEAVERLVDRCLQKDRERRFASMTEVLEELRSIMGVGGTGSLAGVSAVRTSVRPRRRRLVPALLAGALLLAAVLSIPASRDALRRLVSGSTAVPAARLVAVLPFINSLGPGDDNQALADGLTHSVTGLITRLEAGSGELWIVPANEIIQQGVNTAAQARKTFGVDAVITGSVQRIGSITEILLTVVDPAAQPPRVLDSRTVAAPLSPGQRDATLGVLAELLRVGPDPALAGGGGISTSPAAYTLYLQGVGYLQRLDRPGNVDRAIESFGGALAADPQYGPAHAGLCGALWDKFRMTDDQALTDRALESCDRAAELARGEASVLVTIGRIYYETGEQRKAEAKLAEALELEPENTEAHRFLAWVHNRNDKPAEAEAALQKAIELKPTLWVYYNDLGIIRFERGRYAEAAELFAESLRLTPENYLAYNALAVAKGYQREVEAAERLFRRSIELQPNPLAYRNLGELHFRAQRYDAAVLELEKARDLMADTPSFNDWITWSRLAHAYYWAGDRSAAEEAWRRLIASATPIFEVNPKDSIVLMLLTDAHVALGELEKARYYQNRLLSLPTYAVYTKFYIGRIYEMLGDRELALDYIAQALEEGYDPVMVDRDPWLEELREGPRYQTLKQRYLDSSG